MHSWVFEVSADPPFTRAWRLVGSPARFRGCSLIALAFFIAISTIPGNAFVGLQALHNRQFEKETGEQLLSTAVRLKVEENQLVDVFGEIGVGTDGLKSP
jgi:hypothetical protein